MEDFPETALITPFSPSSTSSSQFWTEATGRPVLTAVDLKQSTLDFCFNIDYCFPEHLLITGEFSTDVEIGLAHCRLQLHSGCTQLVFRDVSLSIARAHCSYCPTSRLTNLDKSASESRRDSRYLRHNMTRLVTTILGEGVLCCSGPGERYSRHGGSTPPRRGWGPAYCKLGVDLIYQSKAFLLDFRKVGLFCRMSPRLTCWPWLVHVVHDCIE